MKAWIVTAKNGPLELMSVETDAHGVRCLCDRWGYSKSPVQAIDQAKACSPHRAREISKLTWTSTMFVGD